MPATIRVRVDDPERLTNVAIQQAVDEAAAQGGGVAEVPAGVYWMHNSLFLRDNVRIVGEEGVVLKKVPSISSKIVDFLGYGHYEILVAEPEKFEIGMGVHILDNNSFGFYTTVATIIAKDGELLFLDTMLHHDYNPRIDARAVTVYPIVAAYGASNASLENVTIDGNRAEETFDLTGCRGGGIFIYRSRSVTVRNVEVKDCRTDGISFQQNVDVTVEGCRIHHNTRCGMHPGSGTVRYVMQNNCVHDNGGSGIFYCLRTTHSICRDNIVENNAQAGISIGDRDTDHWVVGNRVTGNGQAGVVFRPPCRISGDRVRLEGNTIAGNCRREPSAEIDIADGLKQIHIVGNTIEPDGTAAIRMGASCEGIYVEGNTIAGRAQQDSDVTGQRDGLSLAAPSEFPPLGPSALPLDGARHLNIAKLPKL